MLRIDLRPSRLLSLVLVLAHGMAVYAVWISLGGLPKILAAVAVLASLAATLAHALLRAPRSAVSLELAEDGRVSWRDRRGAWHDGTLGASHFVSPFLVVVELKPGNRGVKRLILLADSASRDELRRLRVRLRWGRQHSVRNNLTEN
jgi:toxin CptA